MEKDKYGQLIFKSETSHLKKDVVLSEEAGSFVPGERDIRINVNVDADRS